MNELLKQETETLARAWAQHDPAWLRDYLVAGVEDPRLNIQSMLSRHFLVRALAGDRFEELMAQEYRFGVAMQWLTDLIARNGDPEELAAVLHALRCGSDNAEGVNIPHDVLQTFSRLPLTVGEGRIPNYIEYLLDDACTGVGKPQVSPESLNTFCEIWKSVLSRLALGGDGPKSPAASARPAEQSPGDTGFSSTPAVPRISVLEPACGSANDYRFLDRAGMARFLNYTGFDLCPGNIENARSLFPGVPFEVGNVFEISAPEKAFDWCIVHDLFEHLSPKGIETAVKEICRVCRRGVCIGFFQMDEIPEHVVRPVEMYHWNLLSRARMEQLFLAQGFRGPALHIGAFLRGQTGCNRTHNPNAYTFLLWTQEA